MHGLILRTVQHFVEDMAGANRWHTILKKAALPDFDIEPMLVYEDEIGARLFQALEGCCNRPLSEFYEDLGVFLVTHPKNETVRRLLRFSGVTFEEFVFSLDDLPGRVSLAVPELVLPYLAVKQTANNRFELRIGNTIPGFGHTMVGVIRAIADDYGDLVVVSHAGLVDGQHRVDIDLMETGFAEGRDFDLAEVVGQLGI